jgi:hypothetical protein
MKRTIVVEVREIVFVFLMVLVICITAVTARAQDCESTVVDQVGIKDLSIVQAAASRLVDQGADVRVRIIDRFMGLPGADGVGAKRLEDYEYQLLDTCLSWQGTGHFTDESTGIRHHSLKNNLIVMMVATGDRKAGGMYGDHWITQLDPIWTNVRVATMTPYFKRGAWTAGLTAGLDRLATVIHTPVTTTAVPPQPQPESPQTHESGSSGWLLFLITCLVGLSGWGLVLLFRWRRQVHESRSGAQQSAKEAQNRANGLLIQVNGEFDNFDKDKDKGLTARIRGLIDAAGTTLSGISDPNSTKFGPAAYGSIRTEYLDVITKLEQAQELMAGNSASTATAPSRPQRETVDNSASQPQRENRPRVRRVVSEETYRPQPTVINRTVVVNNPGPSVIPVFIPEYQEPYGGYRAPEQPVAAPQGDSGGWGASKVEEPETEAPKGDSGGWEHHPLVMTVPVAAMIVPVPVRTTLRLPAGIAGTSRGKQ